MDLQVETALDAFADFCSTLVLENGTNMELQEFQRWMLAPYFGEFVEVGICVPTGNGKTSLLGALALYHCINTPDANVILAAAARDQASKMLEQAGGFVKRTKWLDAKFKLQLTGHKRILSKFDGGVIQAISADANTADGAIPTLVCVDELHRHKSSELYGVLRDKCAKRSGKIISISTAGDSEESPLGRLRTRALALPNAIRNGVEVTAEDEYSGFAWRELSLKDDDDHEDFDLVALANPLHIHSPMSLKKRYLSASIEPWQWARFTCGIWLGGENSAFDAVAWKQCGKWPDIAEGTTVWVGVDLGWRYDSTALVPFFYDESLEGQEDDEGNRIPAEIVGLPTIIDAPGDGTSTQPKEVLRALSRLNRRTPIECIVIDPNAEAGFLIEAMQDHERWPELNHIRVVEHSQNPSPMADACMGLAEAIRAHKIAHCDGHSDLSQTGREKAAKLTAHVMAAGVKPTSGEQWRIVKQKGGRKIDAAVALAIVRAKRLEKPAKPKITAETYSGWKI